MGGARSEFTVKHQSRPDLNLTPAVLEACAAYRLCKGMLLSSWHHGPVKVQVQ